MTQVGPDRVEEWPNWMSMRKKTNRHLIQNMDGFDRNVLLDAAREGEQESSAIYRTVDGGIIFRISYKITNVIIEEVCPDGHDWGQWSYDMMGSNVRRCERCGEHEWS